MAAGPQWFHSPGSRIFGCCGKQEPGSGAHLPAADTNSLLSVADHCLRSVNYVNVIVADKKEHIQFLDMDEAIAHCTKGISIWNRASNDQGVEPDVVMASCGDVPTTESLAATALLRQHLPDAKVRFVNVVDLFRLVPHTEHPHGMTDREFEAIFTPDKPVVFNFHGYPWLIHRLTYRRPGQHNIHVRGYKEQGNINTPLSLPFVIRLTASVWLSTPSIGCPVSVSPAPACARLSQPTDRV
jgi:Phosphoketolase